MFHGVISASVVESNVGRGDVEDGADTGRVTVKGMYCDGGRSESTHHDGYGHCLRPLACVVSYQTFRVNKQS